MIMYTKTGCPWCNEARSFLNSKKIEFEEREVRGNEEYYKELVDKSGQDKTPTIDLDGDVLADADAKQIEEFLRGKGIIKD